MYTHKLLLRGGRATAGDEGLRRSAPAIASCKTNVGCVHGRMTYCSMMYCHIVD